MSKYASWSVFALLGALTFTSASIDGRAYGQDSADGPKTQSLLGPGLYVFQTRTRASTCNDSERNGYVMSFFAAIDGIPGSTTMTMQLVNTSHFVKWSLRIAEDGTVLGESKIGTTAGGPETHFSATVDGERWKGTGSRSYNGTFEGKPARCRVDYDTLLRRIDAAVAR